MTAWRPKPAAVDTAALLGELDAFWRNPTTSWLGGQQPGRIGGSAAVDQVVPEGTRNPYWEIIRRLPLDTWGQFRLEVDLFFFEPGHPVHKLASREALCMTFSWGIPSPGDIAWIATRLGGRGVVEPGAGSGYWAWLLTQAGADVVAYEPVIAEENNYVADGVQWHPVLRDDHGATARHPGRAMLLCWPEYAQPWAAWSLAAYRGDQLFYVGEGAGGCCADDEFFALLDAEWDEAGVSPAHVTWSGINCYLAEYRRRGAR
ncbi:MAG TPA: hypothetical protein VK586_03565 [Streptosporangiaceae bacterium]|nr:hypothetical protein [Streptosporangiaceae bacterium]